MFTAIIEIDTMYLCLQKSILDRSVYFLVDICHSGPGAPPYYITCNSGAHWSFGNLAKRPEIVVAMLFPRGNPFSETAFVFYLRWLTETISRSYPYLSLRARSAGPLFWARRKTCHGDLGVGGNMYSTCSFPGDNNWVEWKVRFTGNF